MTELEKQIITYLPFNIKVKILNHKSDYVGIEYSTLNGFYFLNGKVHFTYEGGSTGKSTTEIKLILNPLSDLTKLITHEGDSFIPTVEYHSYSEHLEEISTLGYAYTKYLQQKIFIILLELHFDVFGLTEKD